MHCRWLITIVCLLLGGTALLPARADERPGCDSCRIRIDSLEQPVKLAGNWLFTRDDDLRNSEPGLDTAGWVLLPTPGMWNMAYSDGRLHQVGWYRGNFEFAPALVGQPVVLLINAYMSPVRVFVDGAEVYRRPDNASVERYFSIQPIPVRFTIVAPQQTIALRIETPLMTGVYQLPFELRRLEAADPSLALYQFWGGDLRIVVGYVVFFFGLFFLLVYAKTGIRMYLHAAQTSLVAILFYAGTADFLLRIVSPEVLFAVHYLGLYTLFPGLLFCQCFHRFMPRTNIVLGTVYGLAALTIPLALYFDDQAVFQAARSVYFLTGLVCIGLAFYQSVRGAMVRQPGAGMLALGSLCMLLTAMHDMLLAKGLIASISLTFVGAMAFLAAMLYVASSILANTFRENRRLLRDLGALNDNLESLVAERTNDLTRSLAELKQTQASLVEAEKLASLGALVAGVAHELNTPIGNAVTAASTLRDRMAEVHDGFNSARLSKSLMTRFVGDGMSIVDLVLRSCERAATLISSFKRVAVDQTSEQRRPFALDALVADILNSLKPSLRNAVWQIESAVPAGIKCDSYPGPLGQVLTNLVQNAGLHAFSENGAGTLRISAALDEKGMVDLVVNDDGKGMDAATAARIFDPFFTTRLGSGGSGLGLFVSHNLVTRILGGSVTVASQPGRGSRFVVRFPVVAPRPAVPAN